MEPKKQSWGLLLAFLANGATLGLAVLMGRFHGRNEHIVHLALALMAFVAAASGYLIRRRIKVNPVVAAALSLLIPIGAAAKLWQVIPAFVADAFKTPSGPGDSFPTGPEQIPGWISVIRGATFAFVLGLVILFGIGWALAWWKEKKATTPAS